VHEVHDQRQREAVLQRGYEVGLTSQGVVLPPKRFDLFPHRLLKVVLCFRLDEEPLISGSSTEEAATP
jgi:hypothetical protein